MNRSESWKAFSSDSASRVLFTAVVAFKIWLTERVSIVGIVEIVLDLLLIGSLRTSLAVLATSRPWDKKKSDRSRTEDLPYTDQMA